MFKEIIQIITTVYLNIGFYLLGHYSSKFEFKKGQRLYFIMSSVITILFWGVIVLVDYAIKLVALVKYSIAYSTIKTYFNDKNVEKLANNHEYTYSLCKLIDITNNPIRKYVYKKMLSKINKIKSNSK